MMRTRFECLILSTFTANKKQQQLAGRQTAMTTASGQAVKAVTQCQHYTTQHNTTHSCLPSALCSSSLLFCAPASGGLLLLALSPRFFYAHVDSFYWCSSIA